MGVSYASPYLETVVTEVFQGTRTVTLSAERALVGWMPTRPLRLLGLDHDWPLRNGASHSLNSAPKPTCRAWAAAIHDTWPDLDGLMTMSTMTGQASVVLFAAAASAFPASPDVSSALDQFVAKSLITPIARKFGWPVRSA